MKSFLFAAALLLVQQSSGHRIEKRQATTCSAGSTRISSAWQYSSGLQCSDLIGSVADLYHLGYRQECQRWFGGSQLPAHVSHYFVTMDNCIRFSNGTIRYRADICCDGDITAKRCFSCPETKIVLDPLLASHSIEQCLHGGQVETCSAEQTCQTSLYFRKNQQSGMTEGFVTKGCVSACNSNMQTKCTDYTESPECHECCSAPFCNYAPPSTILTSGSKPASPTFCFSFGTLRTNAFGEKYCNCPPSFSGAKCEFTRCQTMEPCQNNAVCEVNQVAPYYSCDCKFGWTGVNCDVVAPACTNNICKNGGSCVMHGAHGNRCRCPTGFHGSECEIPVSNFQCSATNHVYEFKGEGIYNPGATCTSNAGSVSAFSTAAYFLQKCLIQLGGTYVNYGSFKGIGELVHVEQINCLQGDERLSYKVNMCCPSCFSSPCQNDGLCMQDGIDYTCKCRFGFEGRHCEIKSVLCLAWGDPHYFTYDQQYLPFQGACKYLLTAGPGFQVFVKNENPRNIRTIAITKYVEVVANGAKIRMEFNDTVLIDGIRTTHETQLNGISYRKNGRFMRVESNTGVIVEFDGAYTLLVKIQPDLSGKLTGGICADYNKDKSNDLKTKGGEDMTGKPNPFTKVGNSWKVPDPEQPECTDITEDPNNTCSPSDQSNVDARCNLISASSGPFKQCLASGKVNPDRYHRSCQHDLCAILPNDIDLPFCGLMASIAAECAAAGYITDWRTSISYCSVRCPAGMIFFKSASACQSTCANPHAADTCNLPDAEVCACPYGQVLEEESGTCRPFSECGCVVRMGSLTRTYTIGQQFRKAGCSLHRCVACTTTSGCSAQQNGFVQDDGNGGCGSDETCELVDRHFTCKPKFYCTQCSAATANDDCLETDGSKKKCPKSCANCVSSDGGFACAEAGGLSICPGVWGSWSSWSSCVTSGSTMSQSRHRTCSAPGSCTGNELENKDCPGVWGPWSRWSACSFGASQTRNRRCSINGRCNGSAQESKNCPAGILTSWSSWSGCLTHTTVQENRNRNCNPVGMCDPTALIESRNCPPVWGDWSDWGPCQSSNKRFRFRTCLTPSIVCNGAETEHVACTYCSFNAPTDCPYCRPNDRGLLHMGDGCNNRKFYKCTQNNGIWQATEHTCAPCTVWNQAVLTCIHDSSLSATQCVHPVSPPISGTCNNKPNPLNPQRFIQMDSVGNEFDMPCAPGTRYSTASCTCGIPDPSNPEDRRAIFCLSMNTVQSLQVSKLHVENYGVTFSGQHGIFNGHSRLEIPYFSNKPLSQFTALFRYRRQSGHSGEMGLVSNGNCRTSPSIHIRSDAAGSIAAGLHTDRQLNLNQFTAVQAGDDTWHTVAFTYDGSTVKLYLDGVLRGAEFFRGIIKPVHCGIVVGSSWQNHYLHGNVKDLCIYEYAVSEAYINQYFR